MPGAEEVHSAGAEQPAGFIAWHIVPCWHCRLPAHESQVFIFQEFSEPLVKIRRYEKCQNT